MNRGATDVVEKTFWVSKFCGSVHQQERHTRRKWRGKGKGRTPPRGVWLSGGPLVWRCGGAVMRWCRGAAVQRRAAAGGPAAARSGGRMAWRPTCLAVGWCGAVVHWCGGAVGALVVWCGGAAICWRSGGGAARSRDPVAWRSSCSLGNATARSIKRTCSATAELIASIDNARKSVETPHKDDLARVKRKLRTKQCARSASLRAWATTLCVGSTKTPTEPRAGEPNTAKDQPNAPQPNAKSSSTAQNRARMKMSREFTRIRRESQGAWQNDDGVKSCSQAGWRARRCASVDQVGNLPILPVATFFAPEQSLATVPALLTSFHFCQWRSHSLIIL